MPVYWNVQPFGGLGYTTGYVPTSGRAVAARSRANLSMAPSQQRNVHTAQLMRPRSTSAWQIPYNTAKVPQPRSMPTYTNRVQQTPVLRAPIQQPQIVYKTDPALIEQMAAMRADIAKAQADRDAAALEKARGDTAPVSDGKILGMKKTTAAMAAGAVVVAIFVMKD